MYLCGVKSRLMNRPDGTPGNLYFSKYNFQSLPEPCAVASVIEINIG